MNFLKKIDVLRRSLMHKLTKNIGNNSLTKNIDLNKNIKIERVLIIRPNHRLGNLLLITPLVQEVINTFPNCKIDLFIKGNLGPIVFKNYKNIDNIFKLPRKAFKKIFKYFDVWRSLKKQKYDLAINVAIGSSSGRIATKICNANIKIFGDVEESKRKQYDNFEHIAKKPIYSLRNYLAMFGSAVNNNDIPSINLKLSSSELAQGQKIVAELANNSKKTICLFTYATADKCYSKEWWLNFYNKLQESFSDYNFIEILPIENISMIDFKVPSFYSKDIREMCALMANTSLFIGADSGIMHLASAAKTPTVGLFSRSNQLEYQPFNNKSLAVNTNRVNFDDLIKIISKII